VRKGRVAAAHDAESPRRRIDAREKCGSARGCAPFTARRCNLADLVSFGRSYIANPDLVERLRTGAPLNVPDRATFCGGDAAGYTDYPALTPTERNTAGEIVDLTDLPSRRGCL
jgi:hypothetical protein